MKCLKDVGPSVSGPHSEGLRGRRVIQSRAQEGSPKESLTLGRIINITETENRKINGIAIYGRELEKGHARNGD